MIHERLFKAISRKDIKECLSKEAHFYREINRLTILSSSVECSKQLMDVVQYAKTIPEELNIQIINVAEDYENEMLQVRYELCEVSVDDVNEGTVKWLLIDCNKSKKKDSIKSRIKWLIISVVTAVTFTAVITIGTYYYYTKGEKRIKQKQEEEEQRQQQQQEQRQQTTSKTSSRKLNEITDHTIAISMRTTVQTKNSSDSKFSQNKEEKKAHTKEKIGMKRNELEEIHKRINRQADEELQQEKSELMKFYKQMRQCFPEKTEKTQEQSAKKQISEEVDSNSLTDNTG
uniref:Transmembrane protein n=1 Tax=Elaeophora elaphi TaxID=1147741 RepID=A0A0R3RRA7_9BILA